MADFRLEAQTRTEFGKGSARRTRREGRIPAVLYGHGQDVVHLSLPAREFAAALRNGGSNALLTVVLDGKEQLALTKAVQRDPISAPTSTSTWSSSVAARRSPSRSRSTSSATPRPTPW